MDPQSVINMIKQMINTKFQKDEDLKLLMQLFDIISNQYNKTSKLPEFLVDHDVSFLTNHNNENGKRPLNGNCESDDSDKSSSSSSKLSRKNEESSLESATTTTTAAAAAVASNNKTSSKKANTSISNLDLNKSLIKIEPDLSLACSSNSIPSEDSINQNDATANNNNPTENFEIIDAQIEIIKNNHYNKTESHLIAKEAWSLICDLTFKDLIQSNANCDHFINSKYGLDLILKKTSGLSKSLYAEIFIGVLGLLGNISEFREYRNNLLKKDMIAYLRQLLSDKNETISFLASRVLVNIISSESWQKNKINKDHNYAVLVEEIRIAIDKLHENKRINFNLSLNTILILLGSNDDICVYWACWTLANLTTNELKTYAPAISNGNCINLLDSIKNSPNTSPQMQLKIAIINRNLAKR